MRIKDLLRFFVCAGLFIVGYLLLSRSLPPPQPQPDKPRDPKTDKAEASASPATAVAGFGAHLALEQKGDDERQRKRWTSQSAPWFQIGGVAGAGWAATGRRWPETAVVQRKLIALGDESSDSPFHLQVTFDPRGAAVRRVVLNKFKSSDRLGHPIDVPLELIPFQADLPDYRYGSNVLFHYDADRPGAKQRPLDTLGKTEWRIDEVKNSDKDTEQLVRFVTVIQGVEVTKTFSLSPRTYHIGLEVGMRRTKGAPKDLTFRYQLSGALGLPIEGAWYTSIFRHSLIGMMDGGSPWRNYQDNREIALKQGGDDVKRDQERRFLYAGVAVQYFASIVAIDDVQKNQDFIGSVRPTCESRVLTLELEDTIRPGFSPEDRVLKVSEKRDRTRTDKYILSEAVHTELLARHLGKGDRITVLVVPDTEDQQVVVKLLREGQAQPQFQDDITVRLNTEQVELPASEKESVVHKYLLYNGPVKPMLLGQMTGTAAVEEGLVDRYVKNLHLNTLTDYHSPGGMGRFANSIYLTWLIIQFTNLCHTVLNWLHFIIPSYGICIMLLTVLVRGLMFPMSRKQALTSMKMQALQPELKKLKEKFKDDRQGFAMAQMDLFRKNKISMFGSCWMIFLQMPIFMGLYYCLQESVHFRLAPFLWIRNLAAPDMLVFWTENVPLISRPEDYGSLLYLGPYLNLLPIVAVTLMIYQQQKMMPPAADEQQAMQQKMMKYMMIFFGLMFYKVAAGLCVYFITSSLWGFTERKLLPKAKPKREGETTDDLFDKMRGDPAPAVIAESKPAANGQSAANNRAKRRQERKRKQDRAGGSPIATETPAATSSDEAGWWSNMRRKVGNWWKDVLKKASKK